MQNKNLSALIRRVARINRLVTAYESADYSEARRIRIAVLISELGCV